MGQAMRQALMDNLSNHRQQSDLSEQDAWINQVRACIGSKTRKPLVAAIAKIKAIIHEFTRQPAAAERAAAPSLSDLDIVTLEDWRIASKHPDVEVCGWQRSGVPGGIKLTPTDIGGIFPPAADAASSDASELHFNPHTFCNYAGVEEHEATEKELQLHIDAKHLAEFDSYDELSRFVKAAEAEPAVLNKIGLIVKVKQDEAGNPVEKARMILDTKESGVGALSGKHQRVILPRLLDAVLRLLYLMSIAVLDPAKSITAFVLDFTQAFWQIPIAPEERKFF